MVQPQYEHRSAADIFLQYYCHKNKGYVALKVVKLFVTKVKDTNRPQRRGMGRLKRSKHRDIGDVNISVATLEPVSNNSVHNYLKNT